MHTKQPLSADEMQAAFRAVAGRDWPPLHELAMAAARYELVLGTAARRARGSAAMQTPAPAPLQAVPPNVNPPAPAVRPPVPAGPPRALRAPMFDNKRAAAGEREDDE